MSEFKKCSRCRTMVDHIRCRVEPIGSEAYRREQTEKYGMCEDCIKAIDRIVGEALR